MGDSRVNPQTFLPWAKARPLIKTGDVLALRDTGCVARMIKMAGRSLHSHVEVAYWVQDSLETVGFCEFAGGRSIAFETYVEKFPCRWDVFRLSDAVELKWFSDGVARQHIMSTRREAMAQILRKMTGQRYGWWSLWWAACRHLTPGLVPAVVNDDDTLRYPPFCSQAIAMACREAHRTIVDGQSITVDLVRWLPDWLTEPADLVRSPLLHYLFSICPDSEETADAIPDHD